MEAASPAIVRRVMCGMVVYTASLLANPPPRVVLDSKSHFCAAEGIARRAFWGYRSKVRVRQRRLLVCCLQLCYTALFSYPGKHFT
jgi:hypothetical protein